MQANKSENQINIYNNYFYNKDNCFYIEKYTLQNLSWIERIKGLIVEIFKALSYQERNLSLAWQEFRQGSRIIYHLNPLDSQLFKQMIIQQAENSELNSNVFGVQQADPLNLIKGKLISIQKKNDFLFTEKKIEKVSQFLANHPDPNQFEKAETGRTPVYLLPEVGVVLKSTDIETAQIRLKKNNLGRQVGLEQNYQHLLIPKVAITSHNSKTYLIEKLIPLNKKTLNLIDQTRIYVENAHQLTEAVREMTDFILRGGCSDLSSNYYPYGQQIIDYRYDNIPFVITEDNQIKIGLVDLESLEINSNSPPISLLKILLRIYPLHAEVIKLEAQKFFSKETIESHQDDLDKALQEGLTRIELLYEKFNDYRTNHPLAALQIDSQCKQALLENIQEELKLNSDETEQAEEIIKHMIHVMNRCIEESNQTSRLYTWNCPFEINDNDNDLISFYLNLSEKIVQFNKEQRDLIYEEIPNLNQPSSLAELIQLNDLRDSAVNERCYKNIWDYFLKKFQSHAIIFSSNITSSFYFIVV